MTLKYQYRLVNHMQRITNKTNDKRMLINTRKKSQNKEENQLKMCNVDLDPD